MAYNQKLPPFILNTKYTCTQHNEKLTEFCRDHDKPICKTCHIKFHRRCEDVPKIDVIVHKVKESVLFEDIFVEIKAVCDNLKEIFEDRVKNKQQLEIMRATVEKSLEERIETIIKQFRKHKETTLCVFDSVTSEISETTQIVQSKERTLRDILAQNSEITRLASNYQTFIAVKQMENIVHETKMDIQELYQNGKFNQHNVAFDFNNTIDETILRSKSLEKIQVTQSPSDVPIKMTRPTDLEAQKEVQIHEPIQIRFKQKIDLQPSFYKGCFILPSGFIVVSDYGDIKGNNCKVLIFNTNNLLISTIKFKDTEGVFDVTPVNLHHFAVSHPRSQTISIINTNTNCVVRSLKTGGIVWGLCCRGRDIVCCVEWKGIVQVNIDSKMMETIITDENVGYDSHVEVGKDMICYTCPRIHKVTVFDNQYNFKFMFKDPTVLNSPRGVAIYDPNHIFVTGGVSNNLVVISTDGKLYRQVLGENDALKNPSCVHYDTRTKKLVLTNWKGPAFIYIAQGTYIRKDYERSNEKGMNKEPSRVQVTGVRPTKNDTLQKQATEVRPQNPNFCIII